MGGGFGQQVGGDELLAGGVEPKQMLAAIQCAAGLDQVSLRLEARQRATRDGLVHLRHVGNPRQWDVGFLIQRLEDHDLRRAQPVMPAEKLRASGDQPTIDSDQHIDIGRAESLGNRGLLHR